MLSFVAIAGCFLAPQEAPAAAKIAPREIRRVPVVFSELIAQPASPSAVVAIEDLPKLATLERNGSDYDDENDWAGACIENAFGRIVECVGDYNGDGRDDLVLGSWTEFPGEEHVELCGWTTIGNPPACVRMGKPISDLLVNGAAALGSGAFAIASGRETGQSCSTWGRVRVLAAGQATRELRSMDPPRGFGNDGFAESVARIARVDGTTLEIAVAALSSVSTYVFDSGERKANLARPDGAPIDFASFVATAPDLDGDGVTELCVASDARSDVWIYSGAKHELIAVLEGAGHCAIAASGDLDGDGVGELCVGAPCGGPRQQGGLCVLSGKTLTPLFSWKGGRERETLGRSVRAQHDLDGDGVVDIVVGACGGTTVPVRGAVYVISGRDGRALLRIDGENFKEQEVWGGQMSSAETFPVTNAFGWALATGDFDGDHLPDLAIGSPQRSGYDCVGKIYLISGVTLRKTIAARADQPR